MLITTVSQHVSREGFDALKILSQNTCHHRHISANGKSVVIVAIKKMKIFLTYFRKLL